jgi:hypothetical protein
MTVARRFTLAILVVAGACSSSGGGGTPDGGKGGNAGSGTGAVGGQSGGAGGNGGQSGGVGGNPGGSGGVGGNTGGAGGVGEGRGGSGGSSDVAGGRGGSGGSRGGAGGAGGSGGAAGAGPPGPADPWPASCVTVPLDQPASAADLTGPSPNSRLGDPPLPGEFIAAKLNGLARTFSTSLTVDVYEDAAAMRWFYARVYGPDGDMDVGVPDSGPGSYLCPPAVLAYSNVKGTTTISHGWSASCCRIDVTKAGGLAGETVEGTFSGILIGGNSTWIKVEEGSFKLVRRATSAATQRR